MKPFYTLYILNNGHYYAVFAVVRSIMLRTLVGPSRAPTTLGAAKLCRSAPARGIRLAPPFLLDDYLPRYQLLSSLDAAKKRSQAYAHLSNCNLCPRLCGVNRFEKTGTCLIGSDVTVNTIAPHFGEGQDISYRSRRCLDVLTVF